MAETQGKQSTTGNVAKVPPPKPRAISPTEAEALFRAGHAATQVGNKDGKRFVWYNVWRFPCGGQVGQFVLSMLRKRLGLTMAREGGHIVARLQQRETDGP
jgi:hypothetical protein